MPEVMATLQRKVFQVNGIQVTVGTLALIAGVLLVIWYFKKRG